MKNKDFLDFALKVIIVHFTTYLIAGLIFSSVFNYKAIFEMDIIKDYYISYYDHNIILGPLMQPIRGLLFAMVLYPLKDYFLKKKKGWINLWFLIIVIGIFSTPSASPSSIEGFLFTKVPLWFHLMGLPEILTQTLAFSFLLIYWLKKPITLKEKKNREEIKKVITAVSSACFAYIGYAIGALASIAITQAQVDIAAAGSNFNIQFMFILAFIINIVLVYYLGPKGMKNYQYFLLFYLIDSIVPFIYSILFLGPQTISINTFTLGLLPAIIITISIKYNYKK